MLYDDCKSLTYLLSIPLRRTYTRNLCGRGINRCRDKRSQNDEIATSLEFQGNAYPLVHSKLVDLYQQFKIDHLPWVSHFKIGGFGLPWQPTLRALKGWLPTTLCDKQLFQREVSKCRTTLRELEATAKSMASSVNFDCNPSGFQDATEVKLRDDILQAKSSLETVASAEYAKLLNKTIQNRRRALKRQMDRSRLSHLRTA